MEASRLRFVLNQYLSEHQRLQLDQGFSNVVAALKRSTQAPSPETEAEFQAALKQLRETLSRSRTGEFVESARRILESIGGAKFNRDGLEEEINEIVSESPFLPAQATKRFQSLANELTAFVGKVTAARDSLAAINIECEPLGEGEYELGVLIPESVTKNDLDEIAKGLKDWNQTLKDLLESITGKAPRIDVRGASSGSFDLFISLDTDGALALSMVVGGIIWMYQRIQKAREKKDELKAEGYSEKMIQAAEEHEEEIRKEELLNIKKKLLAQYPINDEGRRNELEPRIKKHIEFIAESIRKNVDVEVSGPPTTDDDEAAEIATPELDHRMMSHHVRGALTSALRQLQRVRESPAQLPQNASGSGVAEDTADE